VQNTTGIADRPNKPQDMPTVLKKPRPREPRLLLSLMEQHDILADVRQLCDYWRELRRKRRGAPADQNRAMWQKQRRVAAAIAYSNTLLLMPRMSDDVASPKRSMVDWPEITFKEDFRFHKTHFMRLLAAVGLCTENDRGRPRWIRVGQPGRQSVVSADWAMMVLMKRLASTASYRDLKKILGGSKTALSDTFLHMLGYLYHRYSRRLSDLSWYEPHAHILVGLTEEHCWKYNATACPYDNIIGWVDGHFMETRRPYGKGCRGRNLRDRDVYNGKGAWSKCNMSTPLTFLIPLYPTHPIHAI
jgi:hypothetical protein